MNTSAELLKNNSLREKTLAECRAMAEHALSQGKPVPPRVAQILEKLEAQQGASIRPEAASRAAAYAALSPGETEADLMAQLTEAHNELSATIQPATPDSVVKLKEEKESGGPLRFFGSVGLVRRMNLIVLVCLLLFVGLFMTEEVSGDTIVQNILNFDARKFFLNQLFLITMAALGASFYNLFEAYKFLTDGTYDSKYESIYWIRFTLGIVSGVMLAQFIYVEPKTVGADGVQDAVNESAAGLYYFTKPLLAFLGGFSARVVYRILTRLVEALESFVDGSAKDALAAREQVARMQLDQQLEKMRQDHAAALGSDRLKLAMQLISMKENLAKGSGNNAEIALALDELLQEAMRPVGGAPAPPTGPSPMEWPGTQPAPGTFDQPVAPQQPLPAFPQNPPVNPVQPGNGDFVLPDFPEFRAETKPNNS